MPWTGQPIASRPAAFSEAASEGAGSWPTGMRAARRVSIPTCTPSINDTYDVSTELIGWALKPAWFAFQSIYLIAPESLVNYQSPSSPLPVRVLTVSVAFPFRRHRSRQCHVSGPCKGHKHRKMAHTRVPLPTQRLLSQSVACLTVHAFPSQTLTSAAQPKI
jgi:hypothetical protein